MERIVGMGRLRLGLLAVVVAGAIAAVLGLVVFAGGSGKSAPKESAAQVKRRALSAVASANDLILHSVQTSTEYGYSSLTGQTERTVRQDRWQDLTTNRTLIAMYDGANQPQMTWFTSVEGGTSTSSIVNYLGHSVLTFSHAVPAQGFAGNSSQHFAQEIEDQLASGMLVFLGSQTVDGRAALHVRWNLPAPLALPPSANGFTPPTPAEVDMWLDPTTYLPIRQESITSKGEVLSQTDDDWLPRTPENLAHLRLVVPPGFTHETAPTSGSSFSFGSTSVSSGSIQLTHP